MAILVHCLNREGICLNTQKTKIKDISEKHKNEATNKNEKIKNVMFQKDTDVVNKRDDVLQKEQGKIIRGILD